MEHWQGRLVSLYRFYVEFRTFASLGLPVSELASDHIRDCRSGEQCGAGWLLDSFEGFWGDLRSQLRLDLLYFHHHLFMQYVLIAVNLSNFDAWAIHVFVETKICLSQFPYLI